MKIVEIRLTNWGGVRDLVMPCGSVTVVSGENGSGKTSIISAIENVFNGGHSPDVIGPYGEKAVVEILLDDGVTIRRTVTRKASEYKVTTADGSVVPSPASYVQKLVTGLSLNPTGLVDAPAKDRIKFLQNAMPLTFTREEIAPLCEGYDGPIPAQMDVQQFINFRNGRYEQRTDLNRQKRTFDGAIESLRRSVPRTDGEDWRDVERDLERRLLEQRGLLTGIRNEATNKGHLLKEQVREECQAKIDEIRRDADRAIADAQAQANANFALIDERMRLELTEAEPPVQAEIETLTGRIATVKEKLAAQIRAEGTKQDLEKLEADAKEIIGKVAKLDRTIDALDALKKKKLDAMPIADVEIRDGQIYYRGLNFDTQCNTALKYLLSFQVAALTLGELPFMIFDGAEALDANNKAEFIDAIKDAGLQVVMAEVRSGEALQVQVA